MLHRYAQRAAIAELSQRLRSWDDENLAQVWPRAAMRTNDARIRIARNADDLRIIGRLRYDLYIARDRKTYDWADHAEKTFLEPLDRFSLNFLATAKERVVGAVRLVRAADALSDPHLALLVEAAHPAKIERTVLNSRFALLPEMGARAMIVPMFQQVYRSGLLAGAKECLLATRAELIPIFKKFGFVPLGRALNDPVAGRLEILTLDLQATSSPHLVVVRQALGDSQIMGLESPHLVQPVEVAG